jgi:hypothetical protein
VSVDPVEGAKIMAKPLLPELADTIGRMNSTDWNWMPFANLRTVSSQLKIDDGSRVAFLQYNSIPDIWAQISQFETALLDQDHPDDKALATWRALASLWAISGEQLLPLTISKLPLAEIPNRSFLTAATRLKPASVRVTSDNWTEVGILSSDLDPIAVLNPATLIAPAVSCVEGIRRLLPNWVVGDAIQDPLRAGLLLPVHLELIYRAARDIAHHLTSLQDAHGSGTSPMHTDRLAAIIEAFSAELTAAGATGRVHDSEAEPRGFGTERLIGVFNRKFADGGGKPEPAFFVPARREFADRGIRGLVVADPGIAATLGKSPEQVSFWKSFALDRVVKEAAVYERVKTEAAKEGFLVVRPDELFSPHLCKLRNGQVTAHRGGTQDYVLPVEALVLMFMDPETLLDNIRIANVPGSPPSAQLTLKLSGKALAKPAAHSLFKTFGQEIQEDLPKACGVWPDFQFTDWKAYYLLTDVRRGALLDPRYAFVFGEALNEVAVPDVASRVEAVRNIRSILADRAIQRIVDPSPARPDGTEPTIWLHACSDAPEALLCEANANPRNADFTRDSDRPDMQYAGLLIMPTDKLCPRYEGPVFRQVPIAQDETPWTIGIDFGTSNTSVYAAPAGRAPARLEFERRIVSPFSNEGNAAEIVHIKDGVLGKNVPSVFQTILQSRPVRSELRADDLKSWGGGGVQAPIWSHRIMFNSSLPLNLSALKEHAGDTVFGHDMKWGIGLEDARATLLQDRVGLYLSQAVLQSLAECAARGVPSNRVSVRFSFPEAFGPFTRRTFMGKCVQAMDQVTGDLARKGVRVQTKAFDAGQFDSCSESRCAATYFATRKSAYLSETVIVLDVGGGTTDIVMIKAGRVLWHGSLRLAGQEAFVNPLIRSRLLDRMLANSPSLTDVSALYASMNESQKLNAVELIVNSDEFAPRGARTASSGAQPGGLIMSIASDVTEESKWLSGVVSFAFGGLVYYAGRVLGQALGQEGCAKFGDERIHLCFGGRGSIMFQHFVMPGLREQAGALFAAAANLKTTALQTIFSEEPKEEVAFGLVAGHSAQQNLVWHEDDVILPPFGESIARAASGETRDASKDFRSLAPQTDWRIVDGLPEFKKFISDFTRHTSIGVEFDENSLRSIRAGANEAPDGFGEEQRMIDKQLKALAAAQSEAPDAARTKDQQTLDAALRSRQPPFILLLRQAIRTLVQEGPSSTRAKIHLGE